MIRTCRICKTERDESFFYPNDKTNRCQACETARKRAERKKRSHSNSDRKSYLMKIHSMSLDEYNTLLTEQNNKCAICGGVGLIKKGNLCVDHDHVKNIKRGLLCHSCNVGIGHFADNINLLKNAIKYLKKWQM